VPVAYDRPRLPSPWLGSYGDYSPTRPSDILHSVVTKTPYEYLVFTMRTTFPDHLVFFILSS
jgi:hypothetical protein